MRSFIITILALILLSSCDEKTLKTRQFTFPSLGWPINDAVTFDFEVPDTTSTYNVFLNMRNNHEYAFDNLWVVGELQYPNGKVVTDTLQYKMAAPDGSFLGKATGGVFENKLWYQEGVRFRESGTYKLQLRHVMRKNNQVKGIDNLAGVLDVGYSLEKSTQNGNK
jgi:gliding motility-associated lipoprotein GldH